MTMLRVKNIDIWLILAIAHYFFKLSLIIPMIFPLNYDWGIVQYYISIYDDWMIPYCVGDLSYLLKIVLSRIAQFMSTLTKHYSVTLILDGLKFSLFTANDPYYQIILKYHAFQALHFSPQMVTLGYRLAESSHIMTSLYYNSYLDNHAYVNIRSSMCLFGMNTIAQELISKKFKFQKIRCLFGNTHN